MSSHLLLMSLGPVQDFIAQARRTRDLWFGSHVLSVLSQKAALAARELRAELVFPALLDEKDPSPSVPNKLLVLVREGEPRTVARAAREAARAHLLHWGMEVWEKHRQLVDDQARKTAEEQLDTLLEFHAAWSAFSTAEDYPEALRRAEDALAARRRLRAFTPWAHQRGGIHKSSLDGARESVLGQGERRGGKWERFRIGRREQLDALGLLKRTGGEPGQFVPVPTIGLAAYTALAKETRPAELAALARECEALGREGWLTRVDAGGKAWVDDFPFDAQVLLPGRWNTHLKEQCLDRERAERFGDTFVRPLLRALGEPFPYVACLVADGDRMGETLRALAPRGSAAHQTLSRALSGFATEARRILQQRHRGVLVYAGGDDVLGFVCLPDALRCAAELYQAFASAMKEALAGSGVPPPTLSVGLGVGHVLESLGDLLTLGRQAEGLAKGEDRDGFALLMRLHSSREYKWRARWPEHPVEALEAAVSLREQGRLPLTKVREVRTLLRRMPSRRAALEDEASWARLLSNELQRVLARVELGSAEAGLTPSEVGLRLENQRTWAELHAHVEAWAERMSLAEVLARAKPRSRGATGGES
ncbi:type III-B CRISPR-associated protein Cas10/Cmr2 [Cystobacter ferrugineus]|uniref:Type III-B CRISPR-associated protein Cas10/Cmr2 n=1 Tax=Cystobacter ferrugineus TaxID=83449 RepID=A0A1L9AV63_9BACT|nr:type III-B CRISPR-associated protein Cas10/Cmr2 [Cystobacter ferrugineus]OJH33897.1 type III-B CRISPR-associated protein Cas10/Cmr2 [Cystobacter ferrugineus]